MGRSFYRSGAGWRGSKPAVRELAQTFMQNSQLPGSGLGGELGYSPSTPFQAHGVKSSHLTMQPSWNL